jgi:hypothetical protein
MFMAKKTKKKETKKVKKITEIYTILAPRGLRRDRYGRKVQTSTPFSRGGDFHIGTTPEEAANAIRKCCGEDCIQHGDVVYALIPIALVEKPITATFTEI